MGAHIALLTRKFRVIQKIFSLLNMLRMDLENLIDHLQDFLITGPPRGRHTNDLIDEKFLFNQKTSSL